MEKKEGEGNTKLPKVIKQKQSRGCMQRLMLNMRWPGEGYSILSNKGWYLENTIHSGWGKSKRSRDWGAMWTQEPCSATGRHATMQRGCHGDGGRYVTWDNS